ncbi:MAG: hypothetical protein TQ37_09000 [Candidatus Synechococcus spongiarum 15L]|uniref:Uncharacterized protein n=1 Tax=Candidatus Synechococcus spongiarum 15L TaxID=1608419 RepID=A0A0G8ARR4_9SYNE|nr:MAG: hypothetical protein TQ37_09000 [Candidatus Synechococcus spongiarum 15L]
MIRVLKGELLYIVWLFPSLLFNVLLRYIFGPLFALYLLGNGFAKIIQSSWTLGFLHRLL